MFDRILIAQRCSIKKDVPKNFTKFTGKHLCQSLLFNKVAGLNPATLLKKRLWHRCFPVNFAKFFRTSFLQNTSGGWFKGCQRYSNIRFLNIYTHTKWFIPKNLILSFMKDNGVLLCNVKKNKDIQLSSQHSK